jgi:hypothetical protein
VTKLCNNLSKIIFFIFFLFILTPSKQLFAESFVGVKLEKFILENKISYADPSGYYVKITFDDNPKLYTYEVYYSQRSEQKVATHRDSWNFVNSKTAVYLGESKTPNDSSILSNGTFQIDDKFINFTKGSIRWQAQYSFVNREIEWQKQAEIRRQEEIKKEQDRIKAEQQKKEAEAKAAIAKKQAEERAAIAKKEYEEQQARFKKQQQEAATQEALINGIKLIAILFVITGLFFYLYKFQKNNTKEFFSKLKQLFLKIWNKRWGKDDFYPIGKILILSTLFMFTWVLFSDGQEDAPLIEVRMHGYQVRCAYNTKNEVIYTYQPYNMYFPDISRHYCLKSIKVKTKPIISFK